MTGLQAAEGIVHQRRHLSGLKEAESLSGLSRLCLCFANCGKLTDSGCAELTSTLSSRTFTSNIVDLSLDFAGVTELGNSTMGELAVSLKTMGLLKRLFLAFRGCSTIDESSVDNLITSIRLKPIEVLSLDFANCSQLTNQVLTTLAKALNTEVYLPEIEDHKRVISRDHTGFKTEKPELGEDETETEESHYIYHSDVLPYRNSRKYKDFYTAANYDNGVPWDTMIYGTVEKGWFHTVLRPPCLQKVCFGFESCRNMSIDVVEQLVSSLTHLDTLLHVELNFESCPNIPGKILQPYIEKEFDSKVTKLVRA